ncbi:UNVERIFIED_CONTAM: hypothetical protein K2H54_046790 [Gekko kuhli]
MQHRECFWHTLFHMHSELGGQPPGGGCRSPGITANLQATWRKWLLWKMDSMASYPAEVPAFPNPALLRLRPQNLQVFPNPELVTLIQRHPTGEISLFDQPTCKRGSCGYFLSPKELRGSGSLVSVLQVTASDQGRTALIYAASTQTMQVLLWSLGSTWTVKKGNPRAV